MVKGTIEAVDMVFILVLGGLIGVVQASGSFESGLLALTQKTKRPRVYAHRFCSNLMVLGGTLCGIEEEAVAFYPVLVPIFIALGYDSIVSVGAIFLASSIGTFQRLIRSQWSSLLTPQEQPYRWIVRRIGACIVGAYICSKLPILVRKIKKNQKLLMLTKIKQNLKSNGQ